MYCSWLILQYNSRVESATEIDPKSPKYLPSDPLQKRLADPWFRAQIQLLI